MHGVLATMQSGSPGLASTYTTDEYGNSVGGSSAAGRYGWHGTAKSEGVRVRTLW